MKRRKISAGDLFLVPVGNGYLPGKVLFASSYFRGVIQVALYRVEIANATDFDALPEEHAALFYTGRDPIVSGCWPWVATLARSERDASMSARIVAGDVWVGDRCLGPASEEDRAALPKMLILGASLVEKMAAALAISCREK